MVRRMGLGVVRSGTHCCEPFQQGVPLRGIRGAAVADVFVLATGSSVVGCDRIFAGSAQAAGVSGSCAAFVLYRSDAADVVRSGNAARDGWPGLGSAVQSFPFEVGP